MCSLGHRWIVLISSQLVCFLLCPVLLFSADLDGVHDQLQQLERKNSLLEQQVRKQQQVIDDLTRKVSDLERKGPAEPAATPESEKPERPRFPRFAGPLEVGRARISGEGAVGFFHQEPKGEFRHAEFRVDEAKIFIEAPIWQDVYFFSELNLATREEQEEVFRLGELYIDAENISRLWNRERWVNLRVGRMDIPFGEEYLVRDAIDNPLISHSLSDLWGVDEGIALYGRINPFQYVVAVMNGGRPALRDYTSDKSVTLRVAYEPAPWCRLSVSGMRTGEIDATDDELSELWFGNGFLRALGPPSSDLRFRANVWEGDVQFHWPRRHLKLAGGYLDYDDNSRVMDDHRDVYYYYVEGLHELPRKWYAAARFSQILAEDGFPLVGQGTFGDYFFSDTLTTDIWKCSLAIGYRWSSNLIVKSEYSWQGGKTAGGGERRAENLFAIQAALRF